ncbi:Gfo/Idh/MocA family protein [Sediminicola luteus]|uniref:Oxidoreductase n=1 Tax=Sediminicola luteus TaxID=319238 RepID=A0A2A4GDH4_9FLAO|nr:Gfo/Idh/MocA family oxidoreductase [Sediminicola luteus]PCE66503.1 oxidoreductase [Sediminicola luteus]
MKKVIVIFVCVLGMQWGYSHEQPIRLGVVGLTHAHVGWILERDTSLTDIRMVGIVEPNQDLAQRYSEQFGFPLEMVYADIDSMLDAVKPEAVAAFNDIYGHLEVVRACAPRGVHVMVEKPLAVSNAHAKEMAQLAQKHGIHLLTNYETSWYASNEKVYRSLKAGAVGPVRKVVIRDGHKGPKKIGVNAEFLAWLTDPKLNGGGALTDFGCYGANLMTWLMDGERPKSVTAITQQMQPENNPNVDDDATIILTYDTANATIQASWDWPMGRKDLEVYGLTGALYADSPNRFRIRKAQGYSDYSEQVLDLEDRPAPWNEPFALFAAVIRDEITLEKYDPYSLENNLLVVAILEAARTSAETKRTVSLN